MKRSERSPFWVTRPLNIELEGKTKLIVQCKANFCLILYLQPPGMVLFLCCGKCDVEESVPQMKLVMDGLPPQVADPSKLGGNKGVPEP